MLQVGLDISCLHTAVLSVKAFAPLGLTIFNRGCVIREMWLRKLNNFLCNIWFLRWTWSGLILPTILFFIISRVFARFPIALWLLNILWSRSTRGLMLKTLNDMLYFVSVSWAFFFFVLSNRGHWLKCISKISRLLNLVEILLSWSWALQRWLILFLLNSCSSITAY